MNDIQITGLTRVVCPTPSTGGHTILAYLDAHVEFVTMKGAAFVKLADGTVTIWEPLAKDDRVPKRSMRMSGAKRREVAQAALPMFRAMGGEVDDLDDDRLDNLEYGAVVPGVRLTGG